MFKGFISSLIKKATNILIFTTLTYVPAFGASYHNDDDDYTYRPYSSGRSHNSSWYGRNKTQSHSHNKGKAEREAYEKEKARKRQSKGETIAKKHVPEVFSVFGQLFRSPKSEPTVQEMCTKRVIEDYQGKGVDLAKAKKISDCIAQNISSVGSNVRKGVNSSNKYDY